MIKQQAVARLVNDWRKRANTRFMEANGFLISDNDLEETGRTREITGRMRGEAETLVACAQALEDADTGRKEEPEPAPAPLASAAKVRR